MVNVDIVENVDPAPKRPTKQPRDPAAEPPRDEAPKPGRADRPVIAAPSAANDKLASQATSVLCGYNRIASISVDLFGMKETADAIWNGNDEFSNLAYEALLGDPVLAKRIASVTAGSPGMLGLVIAYAALGSSVAGVARAELAERKAVRKAREGNPDATREQNS